MLNYEGGDKEDVAHTVFSQFLSLLLNLLTLYAGNLPFSTYFKPFTVYWLVCIDPSVWVTVAGDNSRAFHMGEKGY